MWVYIVRRLLFLPVMLMAVSLITFSLGHYGPGDPVRVMMGNKYNEEAAERIRDELGLNRPFFVQYADYMYGFFQGDFGESLRFIGQPVRDLIVPKMWVSAQLSIAAMIISLSIGLPLGFYIAHKQGRWQDPTAVTISIVLASIPIMVTVPALLWVGCLKTDLIPCSGWGGFFDPRIVVPAITMGIPGVAGLMRLMRASTLDVMGQDFIRTAHSKGTGHRADRRGARPAERDDTHRHDPRLLSCGADRGVVHHGDDHGHSGGRPVRCRVHLQP